MTIRTPHGHYLGWRKQMPDPRDFKFAADPRILTALPPTVDLRSQLPPIYDQGQAGSCTANAGAAAFDYERGRQGLDFIIPSRLFLYYDERQIEGTTGSDAGAEMRDIPKALAQWGVCPESEWPYDLANLTTRPPQQDYTDALANRALQYQAVAQTSAQMMGALAQGFPVLIGFLVFNQYEQIGADGIVHLPGPFEQPLGGHANLLCGYDATLARSHEVLFLSRNSWGTSWGLDGYCWFPASYLTNTQLSSDFWIIQLVSGAQPTPPPGPGPTPADDTDRALWTIAQHWTTERHSGEARRLDTAIENWAKAKGLA